MDAAKHDVKIEYGLGADDPRRLLVDGVDLTSVVSEVAVNITGYGAAEVVLKLGPQVRIDTDLVRAKVTSLVHEVDQERELVSWLAEIDSSEIEAAAARGGLTESIGDAILAWLKQRAREG